MCGPWTPAAARGLTEGRVALEMLALRCIVGDVRGGLLRAWPPSLPPRRVLSRGGGASPGPRLGTRLAVAVALGGGLLAAWRLVHGEKQQQLQRQRVEQLQKAALGRGTFSLLDHTGRRRTKADFLGSWVGGVSLSGSSHWLGGWSLSVWELLIGWVGGVSLSGSPSSAGWVESVCLGALHCWVLLYFGFTHCPDICPEELDKLSGVVSALDGDASLAPVQPVFVTVDPERDDVAALARYVADFHPRLLALTGTAEEVKAAGRDYRVYASAGPRDEDGDYIVDHTVLIYLISPDGLFLDYYNRTKTQDQITASVRKHIQTHVPV